MIPGGEGNALRCLNIVAWGGIDRSCTESSQCWTQYRIGNDTP